MTKVEIKSRGFVRRSRLYYLRDLRGKKARLRSKVRDLSALVAPEPEEIEAEVAAATAVDDAASPAEEATSQAPAEETDQ